MQAGSQSWKAFLFGSTDASNAITVDKPPMSLWPMALSVRVFGLSSWSILVPQALMGVATVGILFATVRRRGGAVAGLLAGAVMALTPVAVLMFRFNNPDALLVLLLTASAAALVKAIEDGRRRWIVVAGALIGFGFLTKQLQALLVVPGFAVAYLVVAVGRIGARIRRLLLGAGAMVAAAGWWIALVMLWPTGSRPYVGGSQTNSILDLTLGYNGLGRITGDEAGSVGGGGGNGGGGWGATGWTRLVDGVIGGQIAWLLPAAVLLTLGAAWVLRRAPRSDGRRALLVVFGGWLVVTFLVFSFMQGIFHEYYTVALAPPIAALVGVGAAVVWHRRQHLAAAGLLAGPLLAGRGRAGRLAMRAAAAGAVAAALAGPAAWSVATAATSHTGSIVTAGPAVAGARGGPGAAGGPGGAVPGGGFPGDGAAGRPAGSPAAAPRPALPVPLGRPAPDAPVARPAVAGWEDCSAPPRPATGSSRC